VSMIKRLDQLSEEDFYVLRGPLESGRQSPGSLAGNLLLTPFLLVIILGIANLFVFLDRIEPAHPVVIAICLICDLIGLIIIIYSIIYSIKSVYQSRETTQYLLTIIVIQSITFFLYLIMLYFIFDDVQFHHNYAHSQSNAVIFAIITFIIGIFVFIFASIRFIKLLEQGEFRKGTRRDETRMMLERKVKQFTIYGIVFGTSVSLIGNQFVGIDLNNSFVVSLGVLIFFVMMFILPEQLVIWYCKHRFKSFNFNEKNEVYPLGSEWESQ